MNIHLKDQDLVKQLNDTTLISVNVGSALYGLNNSNSDSDILNITTESIFNSYSFVWTHHQLQYKENDVDYLYCSLRNFIRNILSGDSTINYEVLFSNDFKDHKDFKFLYSFRHNFNNYQILKSYLGLARRDLKMYKKESNSKKLHHAIRGVWSFEQILRNDYDNNIKDKDRSVFDLLKSIKNNELSIKNEQEIVNDLSNKIDQYRMDLNKKFEAKEIERVMSVQNMMVLDSWLMDFSNSNEYKEKQNCIKMQIESLYDSLQNDVKYSD